MSETYSCVRCKRQYPRQQLRQVEALGSDYQPRIDYCCPKCNIVLFWERPIRGGVRYERKVRP